MGSTLDSGLKGPGLSPARVIVLCSGGKILYAHSTSLHPRVEMGISNLSGKRDEMLGGNLRWSD